MKIGYIGLGLMGKPCALNLINAGYTVHVYARNETSLPPLRDAGAISCVSPKAMAEQCEVIFTNVSDTPDVEAVLLGENGVIEGIQTNSVVIDMSTISPMATQAMAKVFSAKGATLLDAPVSGGPQGAERGTLTMMVGGDETAFQRVLPILEALAKNIVYMGESGAGQITKACNQIIVAQTMAAIGEAFVFARAAGVDPSAVRQALTGGFGDSPIMQVHAQRMLNDEYTPGFKTKLHKKDMAIVMETIQSLGIQLPGAERVTQYLTAAIEQGMAEQDSSVLVKQLEALNQISIKV